METHQIVGGVIIASSVALGIGAIVQGVKGDDSLAEGMLSLGGISGVLGTLLVLMAPVEG